MATTLSRAVSRVYTLAVPASSTSGMPVSIGHVSGMLETDRDAAGNASVRLDGLYEIHSKIVEGKDGSGDSAVAVGDVVYNDSQVLNADDANGIQFGVALGIVASAATTTVIEVLVAH